MKRKALIKLSIVLFGIFFLAVFLVGIEIALRKAGHQPGWLIDGTFIPVDTLVVGDYYYADADGVVHHNPNSTQWREDQAMNSQGFLSRFEFSPEVVDSIADSTNSKKVMLVGDSYTEGYSATVYDSSFAGLLSEHPDFTVLNFGVGATDPVHYRQVVKKYVPQFNPDLVVVVICTENDGLLYDRTPKPFITPSFPVDGCGWLVSEPYENMENCENAYFKSAEESYNYYVHKYTLLGDDRSDLIKFSRRSVLFTRFYLTVDAYLESDPPACFFPEPPFTYKNLNMIQDVCNAHSTPLLFVALPNVQDVMEGENIREKYGYYFNELEWFSPEVSSLERSDYDFVNPPSHFINSGHRKYYDFMLPLIQEKLDQAPRDR